MFGVLNEIDSSYNEDFKILNIVLKCSFCKINFEIKSEKSGKPLNKTLLSKRCISLLEEFYSKATIKSIGFESAEGFISSKILSPFDFIEKEILEVNNLLSIYLDIGKEDYDNNRKRRSNKLLCSVNNYFSDKRNDRVFKARISINYDV